MKNLRPRVDELLVIVSYRWKQKFICPFRKFGVLVIEIGGQWWGIVIFQRNERADQRYCFSLHENRTAVPVGCILPIDLCFFVFFFFWGRRGLLDIEILLNEIQMDKHSWLIVELDEKFRNFSIDHRRLILLAMILRWRNWLWILLILIEFLAIDFFFNLV